MNAQTSKYNYSEWFTSEEMHEDSKKWFSELSFVKDEQRFLKNLIQSFTIRPLNKKEFGSLESFNEALLSSKRSLNFLLKRVQKHMNQLEIMIDDVDQSEMERAYTKTHKKLLEQVGNFLLDYRTIKTMGFSGLSSIIKTGKQKLAIGNPKYEIKEIHEEK